MRRARSRAAGKRGRRHASRAAAQRSCSALVVRRRRRPRRRPLLPAAANYFETRATLDERAAEVQELRGRSARARGARSRLGQRRGALARGAPARPRPAGRAPLHRQGHPGVAEAQRTIRSAMDDRALVERQLGRPPRAFRRVVVRCPFGAPAVTEQDAVRRGGRAVPDDLLPHLPAPRRGGRAARGGGRRRALERRGRARPGARRRPRARDARAAATPARARRGPDGHGRRRVARARHRRQRATRVGSSACTRTPRSRSRARATSSASGSWPRSSRSGRRPLLHDEASHRGHVGRCRASRALAGSGGGLRRLLEESRDRGARERLLAPGRRRDGGAAPARRRHVHARRARRAYAGAEQWAAGRSPSARRRRAGRARCRVVEAAAFHLYARGAVDYAP